MENKDKVQVEIELAKSWFNFAQVIAIVAGFFFATSGIYSAAAQNTYFKMSDTTIQGLSIIDSQVSELHRLCEDNKTQISNYKPDEIYNYVIGGAMQSLNNTYIANSTRSGGFFTIGIILALGALVCLLIGVWRLDKIRKSLNKTK